MAQNGLAQDDLPRHGIESGALRPEAENGLAENPPPRPGKRRVRRLRRRLYEIFESGIGHDRLSVLINSGLIALIVLNVVAFSAATIPAVEARYGHILAVFELLSVAIFTLEYSLRLWSCVEIPVLRALPSWRARLRFARTPMLIIDLLAILPFYLGFLIGIDLRVLRILRLFRFFKLARYSPALQTLTRVVSAERNALLGALLVMLSLLLLAATGIYFLEHKVQPQAFGSVPAAAWWAIATLTTVGYGDVTPITPLGKLFGALVMLFGLAMFALPIAIIATGFSHEANRREFLISWSMVARVPIFSSLDATTVADIIRLLYARTYEKGDVIMHSGDEATSMFFIVSGEVSIYTEAGEVMLDEGDFFGEMALLEHRRRAHDVIARTPCRFLVLDRRDFDRLMHQRPEVFTLIRSVAEARKLASRAQKQAQDTEDKG